MSNDDAGKKGKATRRGPPFIAASPPTMEKVEKGKWEHRCPSLASFHPASWLTGPGDFPFRDGRECCCLLEEPATETGFHIPDRTMKSRNNRSNSK